MTQFKSQAKELLAQAEFDMACGGDVEKTWDKFVALCKQHKLDPDDVKQDIEQEFAAQNFCELWLTFYML